MWLPNHLSQKALDRRGGGVCINRNNRNSSTARPGCERCCCNNPTRVIPQTGVTHIIRLIYIHNAAQGDEHDNLPSIESWPCGGAKTPAEKKFGRERAALNRAKCVDGNERTLVGVFAPLFGLRYGRFEIRWKGNYTEPQHRQTVVGFGQA